MSSQERNSTLLGPEDAVDLDQVLERMPRVRKPGDSRTGGRMRSGRRSRPAQLRGNQPLPQDEIAAQFKVSHIPVREALRQLRGRGAGDLPGQPRRDGHRATPRTRSARSTRSASILETAAMRRATSACSRPSSSTRARPILDAGGSVHRRRRRGVHSMSTSTSSSTTSTERPRLQELIEGLLRRVDRYWLSHGLMLKHRAEFESEHRALLEAIRERNADRAAELLGRHLAGASELLIAELVADAQSAVPGRPGSSVG